MKTKKIFLVVVIAIVAIIGIGVLSGCSDGKINGITVISREEGSGTRDAFESIVGYDEMLDNRLELTSTGNVMTKVTGTNNAIGYISLGSLNNTVKGLSINGVAPNDANILNNTYALYRNFNIVIKKDVTMSPLAQNFITYMASSEAQSIVKAEKYVPKNAGAAYTKPSSALYGTLKISGSTSVLPLMEAFKKAYIAIHPSVKIEVEGGGSSVGIKDVANASEANAPFSIGLASRELKPTENKVVATVIALDGIAVIINPKNQIINNITIDNLKAVYEGRISSFEEIQ